MNRHATRLRKVPNGGLLIYTDGGYTPGEEGVYMPKAGWGMPVRARFVWPSNIDVPPLAGSTMVTQDASAARR